MALGLVLLFALCLVSRGRGGALVQQLALMTVTPAAYWQSTGYLGCGLLSTSVDRPINFVVDLLSATLLLWRAVPVLDSRVFPQRRSGVINAEINSQGPSWLCPVYIRALPSLKPNTQGERFLPVKDCCFCCHCCLLWFRQFWSEQMLYESRLIALNCDIFHYKSKLEEFKVLLCHPH